MGTSGPATVACSLGVDSIRIAWAHAKCENPVNKRRVRSIATHGLASARGNWRSSLRELSWIAAKPIKYFTLCRRLYFCHHEPASAREGSCCSPCQKRLHASANKSRFFASLETTYSDGSISGAGATRGRPVAPPSIVRLATAGSCLLTGFFLKSPRWNPSKRNLLGVENRTPTTNCGGSMGYSLAAKNPTFLLTDNGLGVGYVLSGMKWEVVVRSSAPSGSN